MSARVLMARAPLLALLATILATLLWQSSLLRLLPEGLPLVPGALWTLLGVALLLVPALLARRSPLPATLAVVVPVLALASYGAGRLDWLRTLKDFGVQDAEPFRLGRFLLSLAALAVAYALHAADLAVRLRDRGVERGIPPGQAKDAARATLARNGAAATAAAAGAGALAAIAVVGLRLGEATGVERLAFVAPLVAVALLALAAFLLVAERPAEA